MAINLSVEVGNEIIIKLGNGSWFATLPRVVWNSWEVGRAREKRVGVTVIKVIAASKSRFFHSLPTCQVCS